MTYIRTGLAETDIEFGMRLWNELKRNQEFPVDGMWWLLESDWHLVIVSQVVDELGPRDAYRKMAAVVKPAVAQATELLRVKLVDTKNPLYLALHSVFAEAASVEGARLGGSQVAGIYVEDAYLYGVR